MRKFFDFIPRPIKVLFFFIGILLFSFFIYIFIGAPPFSDEHRYRRAERANMVGPAKILDIIDFTPVKGELYKRMVIADDGDGVILYMYEPLSDRPEKLIYRKKQGAVTVYAAPYELYIHRDVYDFKVPIILFDDFPQAIRAELECILWSISDEKSIPKTMHPETVFAEAYRDTPGYFCFHLNSPGFSTFPSTDESEQPTLMTFCRLTSRSIYDVYANTELPVTIRLFDKDNNLIHEEIVTVRNVVGEAHYQRSEHSQQ